MFRGPRLSTDYLTFSPVFRLRRRASEEYCGGNNLLTLDPEISLEAESTEVVMSLMSLLTSE
jgi:hypothetical protein